MVDSDILLLLRAMLRLFCLNLATRLLWSQSNLYPISSVLRQITAKLLDFTEVKIQQVLEEFSWISTKPFRGSDAPCYGH